MHLTDLIEPLFTDLNEKKKQSYMKPSRYDRFFRFNEKIGIVARFILMFLTRLNDTFRNAHTHTHKCTQ